MQQVGPTNSFAIEHPPLTADVHADAIVLGVINTVLVSVESAGATVHADAIVLCSER